MGKLTEESDKLELDIERLRKSFEALAPGIDIENFVSVSRLPDDVREIRSQWRQKTKELKVADKKIFTDAKNNNK